MTSILDKFPNEPAPPYVESTTGPYIILEDGRKILDASSGITGYAVLGYSHPDVITAMNAQMKHFSHMDINQWGNRTLEKLADLILTQAPPGLDKVYFAGNSGSEAVEAAMKISYHLHHDSGKKEKRWFISRENSFSGATLQTMSVSDIPVVKLFEPLMPANFAKIAHHNPYSEMKDGESLNDYAEKGAHELEKSILDIGPDNVCAFVAETVPGTLMGYPPPAPNYWKLIKNVCEKYDVHLILDEVFCGLGRSGKIYCCSWDDVSPDFLCVGKNLGAGYAPISAVLLNNKVQNIIAAGSGRVQLGHTHQGYSLGASAALAVQRIVHQDSLLSHISDTGNFIAKTMESELGQHPYFKNVRGRGLMQAIEFKCPSQVRFSNAIKSEMLENHNILLDCRWHRAALAPAYIIEKNEIEMIINCFLNTFKKVADNGVGEKN